MKEVKKEFKKSIPLFYIPIDIIQKGVIEGDIVKSEDDLDYNNMFINGCASTEDLDLDKQIMTPSGFILDYFLKCGFINWNHGTMYSPDALIGEPQEGFISNNEFHIKGQLWSWSTLAKSVYRTIYNIKKYDTTGRRIGYSVEGIPIESDDFGNITKTLITALAVAPVPKNSSTYVDIVKGVNFDNYHNFVQNNFPIISTEEIVKGVINEYIVDFTTEKGRVLIDKDFNLLIKGIDTASIQGQIHEDVEKGNEKAIKDSLGIIMKACGSGLIKANKKDDLIKEIKRYAIKNRNNF